MNFFSEKSHMVFLMKFFNSEKIILSFPLMKMIRFNVKMITSLPG